MKFEIEIEGSGNVAHGTVLPPNGIHTSYDAIRFERLPDGTGRIMISVGRGLLEEMESRTGMRAFVVPPEDVDERLKDMVDRIRSLERAVMCAPTGEHAAVTATPALCYGCGAAR